MNSLLWYNRKPMEQHHKTNGEIDNDKVWAILAYFFFPLPLLFVKNRSTFLNYHINQGIILAIVWIVGGLVFGILPRLFYVLFELVMIYIFVNGIMTVSKKKKESLPIIGDLFNFIK